MDVDTVLEIFRQIAGEIRSGLDGLDDWGLSGGHPGQYVHDVVADEIAIPILWSAGLGVVSEESESQGLDRPVVAIVDPIDGSTNASLGIPWYATSLCAIDSEGLLASLVCNQATGNTYVAARGMGAELDGEPIQPSRKGEMRDSILVLNGLPHSYFGWKQYRALGSAALDLCSVADGTFNGFADFSSGLALWDYAGAALICSESGVVISEVNGTKLDFENLLKSPSSRIRLLAAGTQSLHENLIDSVDV